MAYLLPAQSGARPTCQILTFSTTQRCGGVCRAGMDRCPLCSCMQQIAVVVRWSKLLLPVLSRPGGHGTILNTLFLFVSLHLCGAVALVAPSGCILSHMLLTWHTPVRAFDAEQNCKGLGCGVASTSAAPPALSRLLLFELPLATSGCCMW